MAFIWECLETTVYERGDMRPVVLRAKVPGGWLVRVGDMEPGDFHAPTAPGGVLRLKVLANVQAFFYPDPEHTWDGGTLPHL
jgi:hypothetical protein